MAWFWPLHSECHSRLVGTLPGHEHIHRHMEEGKGLHGSLNHFLAGQQVSEIHRLEDTERG